MTGIVLFNDKMLRLFELGSFTGLNWVVFSLLLFLDKGHNKKDGNIRLSIIISKILSCKTASALLFSLGVNIMVFVKSSEVLLIVSVTVSRTLFVLSWKFCLPNLSCQQNSSSWYCNEINSLKISNSSLF